MPRYCLIVEPIPLVAHDLALTMQDRYGLTSAVVPDPDQGLAWLQQQGNAGRVALAFVHQDRADFADGPLHRLLRDRQAQVVLVAGALAEGPQTPGWPVLSWPFTTDSVVALLAGMGWSAQEPGLP